MQFSTGTAATIQVDVDPTVAGIFLNGNTNITLDFQTGAGARTLTVNGDIVLNQFAGNGTSFTTKVNGANAATLTATGKLRGFGNPAGWMNVTVQPNTTVSLDAIDTAGSVFNVTIGGTMLVNNALLMGKDLHDGSTLNVTHRFEATSELRVGGQGKVDFVINGGQVGCSDLNLYNGTTTTIKGPAPAAGVPHLSATLSMLIGTPRPARASSPGPPSKRGPGRKSASKPARGCGPGPFRGR